MKGMGKLKSVVLKMTNKALPPPVGNPFDLFVSNFVILSRPQLGSITYLIDTGLELSIPDGYAIRISGVGGYLIVQSVVLNGDSIRLVVMRGPRDHDLVHLCASTQYPEPEIGEMVGRATIVEENIPAIRFIEKAETGGRVIRGDSVKCE